MSFDELTVLYNDFAYRREAAALGIFLLFIVARTLFTRVVVAVLRKLTARTKTDIDAKLVDALEQPLRFLCLVIGLSLALRFLEIPDKWLDLKNHAILTLYAYTLFWGLYNVVNPVTEALFLITTKFGRQVNEDLRYLATRSLQIVIVVIGVIAVLEEWGLNIAAFLGGLGLVGMAVALAAKDSVANLFGTLMIFMDKTFHKGDWIQTPDIEGTVEMIGLRATRIRTFSKALITMPNAKLANSPVTNWSRMTNRRIKMTIGLEYRATADQIEKIVDNIREYVATHPEVEAKGPVAQMVHLVGFGPSSIDINLYYFTKTTDWEKWRQIRSEHILAFKRIVEEQGCSFAFPSTSVYVEEMPQISEMS